MSGRNQATARSDPFLKLNTKNPFIGITYTQIFKNAHGNDLDPKRQGLNRDFGRVCVVTPEIAVIAIADGCGLVSTHYNIKDISYFSI